MRKICFDFKSLEKTTTSKHILDFGKICMTFYFMHFYTSLLSTQSNHQLLKRLPCVFSIQVLDFMQFVYIP